MTLKLSELRDYTAIGTRRMERDILLDIAEAALAYEAAKKNSAHTRDELSRNRNEGSLDFDSAYEAYRDADIAEIAARDVYRAALGEVQP